MKPSCVNSRNIPILYQDPNLTIELRKIGTTQRTGLHLGFLLVLWNICLLNML